MTNQHNTPLARNGQPQNYKNRIPQNRAQVINAWIAASESAIEALFNWKAYLNAWQTHPNVTDEAFMAAIQQMNEAGLTEWLDASGADIDALRKAVTDGRQ